LEESEQQIKSFLKSSSYLFIYLTLQTFFLSDLLFYSEEIKKSYYFIKI